MFQVLTVCPGRLPPSRAGEACGGDYCARLHIPPPDALRASIFPASGRGKESVSRESSMHFLYLIFVDPFVQMVSAPDLLAQSLWEGWSPACSTR